jgi:hypothetical protein
MLCQTLIIFYLNSILQPAQMSHCRESTKVIFSVPKNQQILAIFANNNMATSIWVWGWRAILNVFDNVKLG